MEMGDEKIVRSKAAKCLGVVIDDELNWKEQVQNVRRKYFTGLAKIRRFKNVLPSTTKKKPSYTMAWYCPTWTTARLYGRSARES